MVLDEHEDKHDHRRVGSPTNRFSIGWGVLSIILTVITVSAVAALVVVASITRADTLSVVALALAVLAFAAQLIVTMAQGQQAAQLTADTKMALAELRATTDSLLATQRGQFDTVLNAAIARAVPAAVQEVTDGGDGSGEGISLADIDSRLQNFQDVLVAQVQREVSATRQRNPSLAQTESDRDQRRRDAAVLMATYPNREEGEWLVPIVRGLSPGASRLLENLGQRYARMGVRSPVRFAPGFADAISELESAKLINTGVGGPDRDDQGRIAISSRGVRAARLLTAHGDPPAWASELSELRQRLAEDDSV